MYEMYFNSTKVEGFTPILNIKLDISSFPILHNHSKPMTEMTLWLLQHYKIGVNIIFECLGLDRTQSNLPA